MPSETDTRPVTPELAECVLLSDGDGTIRWASPNTADVLDRDPDEIRRTETIQSLLGPDAPEPQAVGPDPVSHTLTATTGDGSARDLRVTVESEGRSAIAIYRCRRLEESLTVDDVLARVDDAVVAFDTEWRYTYVNDAAEALLERDAEALLGEYVWDVFPQAEGTPMHETMARAMATQQSETIEWYWEPDDKHLDVRCFPSESGVSLYFRDVTERKEREDALRRERDLVDQLLSVSPTGIAVHAPDGRFLRLNERAETILGIDREVLLGEELNEPAWEAYGTDGEPLPAEDFPLNVALRTGEPTYGTEMSIRLPDGTELWLSASAAPLVDDAGEVERVVVTFEDITDRRRYEHDLRESEQQFRAVFDGTLDALVLADDEGTYRRVNDAACDLYGLDEADLVGSNVADFAPSEYDVAAACAAFVEQGELRGEFPLVRPDGEVRTTDFAATANVVPGVHLSALRDITERKQDRERLADQRDELRRLNRINELIREVHRTVVGATDRDSIETAVCEALTVERYSLAMLTQRTATGTMQVRAAAGLPADLLATFRADGATCLESSMRQASTENALTVLTDLQTDADHHESLASMATARDIQTLVNIPLSADGVAYGVLTVGAWDDDAFGDRERAVLLELGELIAAAIDAVRTKQLLHASGYTELKLTASARDASLVALQERLDRRLSLDGVVPVDSGRHLLYLAVEDTTTAAVEAAADIDGIETARFVDADRRPLVELTLDESTAVSALLDAGGQLQDATVEEGIGEFLVALPLDTDVRTYLDRVEGYGVDMGLLAKREVESPAPVAWDSTTELTDRQQTVLEAAYRSGYFDWPRRGTTGEELAESLDVASSTLHQHLRVATRKALDEYFQSHAGDTP